MPDDVRAILQDVIQNHGQMTEHQAKDYITKLERAKRYQAETWA